MTRLGSELALVYHDVMQAPLPRHLETLVADLGQILERGAVVPADRSALDEISDVVRPGSPVARRSNG